jgi:serine/threonine-protein kinase
MDAQRWSRARELFDRLAEEPAAQWEVRALALCPDDADVRAEALALLRADAEAKHPPLDAVGDAAPELLAAMAAMEAQDALAGLRVGPFVLVRELGRGGMGQVWLGERADGEFAQTVAIKLIRGGWDATDVVARFRAERQILAGLAHPSIAHLVDGGVTADGKPWLALEYVDGDDLRSHCDAARLGIEARLRLFLDVCGAVAYAHARLVVHRDLKPSNLLVDRSGRVKLLDFGIAKLIDSEGAQTATRVFTPEYAAPEQVRGEAVTTAVDVHALGLLLYELLTGRRPYKLDRSTPAACERAILEQEPTRPSLAVTRGDADAAALADRRRLDPRRLRRELRGDLDAIVLKALRKEPAARYASAALLADDVRRHLEREPVEAHRGGWRYTAARLVRRHALALGLAATAFLALAIGLVAALVSMTEARRQRDIAVAEAAKSQAALEFMGGLFEAADPDESQGVSLSARDLLARGVVRIRDALEDQPGARAVLLGAMGQAHRGLGLYEESLPLLEEAARLAEAAGDEPTRDAAELQRAESLHELARFRDELALLEHLAPTDAPTVATRLERADIELRRGRALQALNELDAAAMAYQAAHDTRRELLGDGDWRTQEVALRQVSLLTLRARHRDALPIARDTLTAVRRASSERDPHRAEAISALAMVLTNLDELAEAEALRREELGIMHAVYGAEHPQSAGTENDLAAVLFAQQRLAEAAPLFEHVLSSRRARFGPDHAGVATVANNLAWCELGLGRAEHARELASDALRIRRAAYGEQHHTTAASLRALGASELSLGDLDAAGVHLREALAAYDASLGPDNRIALGTLNDLVRWEVLSNRSPTDCGTARRAAALYGLKPEDDSQPAHFQRVMLQACLIATASADADPAAFQAAVNAVHAQSDPRNPSVGKVDALADFLARRRGTRRG